MGGTGYVTRYSVPGWLDGLFELSHIAGSQASSSSGSGLRPSRFQAPGSSGEKIRDQVQFTESCCGETQLHSRSLPCVLPPTVRLQAEAWPNWSDRSGETPCIVRHGGTDGPFFLFFFSFPLSPTGPVISVRLGSQGIGPRKLGQGSLNHTVWRLTTEDPPEICRLARVGGDRRSTDVLRPPS